MTPATRPSIGTPLWAATASVSRAWAPWRSLCESRISSPVATTVASTSSPTLTRSRPSSSASSARSIHASPLPPTSTKTCSAVIWMMRPFTTWPISTAGPASWRANRVAKSSESVMVPTIILSLPNGDASTAAASLDDPRVPPGGLPDARQRGLRDDVRLRRHGLRRDATRAGAADGDRAAAGGPRLRRARRSRRPLAPAALGDGARARLAGRRHLVRRGAGGARLRSRHARRLGRRRADLLRLLRGEPAGALQRDRRGAVHRHRHGEVLRGHADPVQPRPGRHRGRVRLARAPRRRAPARHRPPRRRDPPPPGAAVVRLRVADDQQDPTNPEALNARRSRPQNRGAPRLRRGAPNVGGLGAISGPPSTNVS